MPYSITVASLSSILRHCGHLSAISEAKQTHVQILIHGLLQNVTLRTDLLLAYSKCGLLQYARKLFDRMPHRNMHSWNIMMSSYVQSSMYQDALSIFNGFLKMGLRPDHYTLPPLLKATAGTGDSSLGVSLHNWVIKLGFENYLVVGSSILDFYLKCGNLSDAKWIFGNMWWKDSVTWNSMITGLGRAGLCVDALSCFRDMLKEGVEMDLMTIPSILSVCGREGNAMKGKEIHGRVMKSVIYCNDAVIGNSLIDMYSKCGFLCNSEKVFRNMRNSNLVTWTTMISCYGVHGRGKEALVLFEEMRDCGFEPNSVTFTAILASCSHSGHVDQGRMIFNSIGSVYNLEPSVEHHACIVDLLGRFGHVEEALGLIKNMRLAPTGSIWGALLAGCMMCKNVEIGEIAAHQLFELEPRNSSNYVALCSIYDSLGMWNGVSRIRAIMKKLGLVKSPGCSWITSGGKVHKFYQGDLCHPSREMLYETLNGILRTLMLTEDC